MTTNNHWLVKWLEKFEDMSLSGSLQSSTAETILNLVINRVRSWRHSL